jgi:hypothetical protein
MSRASTANVLRQFELTDDEAITLRRIAFSESDKRSLRRADVDRLLKLRLIAEVKGNLVLAAHGAWLELAEARARATLPHIVVELSGSPKETQTEWLEYLAAKKRLVLAYAEQSAAA